MRGPSFLRDLAANPLSATAAVLLIAWVLVGAAAAALAPYDPLEQHLDQAFAAPNAQHLLGTDGFGRDIVSRVFFGARVSVTLPPAAILMAALVGVPVGLLAGFFGGWVETVFMRLMDGLLSLPPIFLALGLVGALGSGPATLVLALGVVFTPRFARIARASMLSARELDYVLAARSIGAPVQRLLLVHVLPNAVSPLIVTAALAFSEAIILEASLSFLGLGVEPPTPSWGADLRDGRAFLERAPWGVVGPSVAIASAILAMNVVGDALRDSLDPRTRRESTAA